MKNERKVMFRCDNCSRSVMNKRHIRFLLGWTSGWMMPPFTGGVPVASVSNRHPEFHFCRPECLAQYFVQKLNEIRTDTRGNESKDRVSPIGWEMLEEVGTQRSRMRGEDHMGARSALRREAGERGVGDSTTVRVVTSRRRVGEDDQRVDINQSNVEEGRGKVSEVQLGAEEKVSKRNVWSIKNIWQMIYG